jgi:hypothetical protein
LISDHCRRLGRRKPETNYDGRDGSRNFFYWILLN